MIQAKAVTLDRLIGDRTIDLGPSSLVWMDTQGHEAHVLGGARELLQSHVPVVIEYWPYGLRNAHALERLHRLVIDNYKWIVDTGDCVRTEPKPAAELVQLAGVYGESQILQTNLLLLKALRPHHRSSPAEIVRDRERERPRP